MSMEGRGISCGCSSGSSSCGCPPRPEWVSPLEIELERLCNNTVALDKIVSSSKIRRAIADIVAVEEIAIYRKSCQDRRANFKAKLKKYSGKLFNIDLKSLNFSKPNFTKECRDIDFSRGYINGCRLSSSIRKHNDELIRTELKRLENIVGCKIDLKSGNLDHDKQVFELLEGSDNYQLETDGIYNYPSDVGRIVSRVKWGRQVPQTSTAQLICLKKPTYFYDAFVEIVKRGNSRPATFLESLAFAAKYPEVQKDFPIFAIGSPNRLGNSLAKFENHQGVYNKISDLGLFFGSLTIDPATRNRVVKCHELGDTHLGTFDEKRHKGSLGPESVFLIIEVPPIE
ncbi:MAG: hypothetical protein HY226_00705 [Candidatus Vogelbacteria bacterium]|nr:hypothetical protein [Candidatus Vogelbacteria bacterium]